LARLLLLVPTTSYRAPDFMAAAARLGVEVIVGCEAAQPAAPLSAGGLVAVDFRNPNRGIAQIADLDAARPLDAIVGVDDASVPIAARAAAALGLPHNPPAAVAASGDKHAFRRALAAAGLPTPPFRRLGLGADPAAAARRAPYPCVLKPLALSASRGVIRADDAAGFVAAFARIATLLRRPEVAAGLGRLGQAILVEGFIPGREVALEGLLVAGRLHVLALFDKPDPLDGPFFEETLYVTPARLAPEAREAVAAMARRTVAALGLREGPVHAEFRLNAAGVWPIEMAARSIGGLCSRTLRFATGLALEDLILRRALGETAPPPPPLEGAAGVMMIPIPASGRLVRVDGIEQARAVPGIEDVRITVPIGQVLVPWPEGDRYLGFVFARGDDPDTVEAALRAAHARLSFAIESVAEAIDASRRRTETAP